jgi:preprotein translocase subunit SecA
MNQQRQIIYGVRDQILEAADNTQAVIASGQAKQSQGLNDDVSLKDQIQEKIANEIGNVVSVYSQDGVDAQKIVDEFCTIIPFDDHSKSELVKKIQTLGSADEITDNLVELSKNVYHAKEHQISLEVMRQMEVFVYLNTMDTLWVEHLDSIDDLRIGIGLRGYAQRDPLVEYKREAFDLFEKLIATIDAEVVHRIYKVAVENQAPVQVQPVADLSQAREQHQEALDETALLEASNPQPPTSALTGSTASTTKVTVERDGQIIKQNVYGSDGNLNSGKKPGRNESCWCGSGKKYKKCHYPN